MSDDQPSPRRGRTGTIIGPITATDENLNEPCFGRLELLRELNDVIGGEPVPGPFWAVLMLADIPMLARFIEEAEKSIYLLDFCMHACAALPLIWSQKEPQAPRNSLSSSEASAGSSSEARPRRQSNLRNQTIVELAKKRDNHGCVFRKLLPVEVAHIYPHFLLSNRRTNFTGTFPPFWNVLKYFWAPERIATWHQQIFRNAEYPDRQMDSLYNVICLGSDVHKFWTAGMVAFRPLEYNADKSELQIEWHWQAPSPASMKGKLAITTLPVSNRGVGRRLGPDGVPAAMSVLQPDGVWVPIITGDRFTLRTADPEKLPLPSKELLDMQFVLARLVNLSGAGEVQEVADYDESDPGIPPEEQIEGWLGDITSSATDDDDEHDESGITSGYPSPLKTRGAMEIDSLPAETEQAMPPMEPSA